jgi:DNA-binding transcriptional regulator LsrR (DeoR family)
MKNQAVADITGVFFDEKGIAKTNFYDRLVTTSASLKKPRIITVT